MTTRLQRALHPADDTPDDDQIGDPVESDVDLSGLEVVSDEDGGDHPDDEEVPA